MKLEKIKKQIKIVECKPNNYETFQLLMLLGHVLHEKDGFEYSVKFSVGGESICLMREVEM